MQQPGSLPLTHQCRLNPSSTPLPSPTSPLFKITNMGVLMLLLGAMLLLWSHVIWMIVLLLSMWRFQVRPARGVRGRRGVGRGRYL